MSMRSLALAATVALTGVGSPADAFSFRADGVGGERI